MKGPGSRKVGTVPRAGWPKQPEVTSPQNRTGQAWKQVFKEEVKEDRHGHIRNIKTPIGQFKCRCNAIVRIDEHGNAACEGCGEIYNDCINKDIKINSKKRKNEMGRFRTDIQKV